MNPAQSLIQHLRTKVLSIDPEWSIDLPDGFAWWPHRQRQEIFIDRSRTEDDGTEQHRVCVTTEVIRVGDAPLPTPFVELATRLASLSGPVREGPVLKLRAHAWVCADNQRLYDMTLSLAAVLQVFEARFLADQAAELGAGEPAFSDHPTSGSREEADEITDIVTAVIVPAGNEGSPWPDTLLTDLEEGFLRRPPCLLANADSSGLAAEFPFGEGSSLLRARTSERHPFYGGGLLVTSAFQIEGFDPEGIEDPLTLNAREIAEETAPFFGSWTPSEDGLISFVTFLPYALAAPAGASNCVLLAIGRARSSSIRWLGDDWSETWDAAGNCRARHALERMMDSMAKAAGERTSDPLSRDDRP